MADRGNVEAFPGHGRARDDLPPRIKRPCDWGLDLAVQQLETQLGTVEAFNRLVAWALVLKAQIESGDVKAQNPLYAVSITGAATKSDSGKTS